MSTVHRDIRQERDRVSRSLVVLAAVLVAAISAIYVAVSWALTSAPPGAEVDRLPGELGVIEAARWEIETRAEVQAREDRARLNSYGWMDRDGGIIHIPIDRAIELYLQDRAGSGLRSEIESRRESQP